MKIEFITSYFYPYTGGIESVVLHLAQGLSQKGHTIIVHTGNRYPGSVKKLLKQELHNNILIKRYPLYPFSLFFPKLEFTDSVISLHNYSALMNDYVSRRYPKQKKIMTPYGNITYSRSQRKYPFFSVFYDFLFGKKTLFEMDKIVAMTNFEQNNISKKYPKLRNKTITIPAGVELVKVKTFSKITLPKKYFFSIGRITKSKKFEDVLSILEKFPSYHYLLAGGDNGYLSHLQKVAREKGVAKRFDYLGKVTEQEKAFLMQHATVFIMPSTAEAFSIASVEAFCYSKRIVAANSGGIIDVYSELGGELYETGNSVDLSLSLIKILKHSTSPTLLARRKRIIQKKYNWNIVVKQYEKAFSK